MKRVQGWAYPDSDEFMLHEMKPDGSYQASHLHAAVAHVTARGVALDGGAHVGTWSRILSGLFTRVIAVEPSDDTFEALADNMRSFGCDNVELHHAALGAAPGQVHMTIDPRGAALKNTGARYVQAGGTIPLYTIDAWHLEALDFLKLDVEGSEALALAGARETLRRCRPIVLFENKGFWRRYGQPKHAPHDVLTSVGYRFLEAAGKDSIWGPTPNEATSS